MAVLESIEIKGYKSIDKRGQCIDFGRLTVLLGANGSGKSNLISFFKMLNFMTNGALQTFIARSGNANSLLYMGTKITSQIQFKLRFSENDASSSYESILSYGMPDALFFSGEHVKYSQKLDGKPQEYHLQSNGRPESGLRDDERETSRVLLKFLSGCRVYQFHDTSDTSRIRGSVYLDDCKSLSHDAGNLAAFLFNIRENHRPYYDRIVNHIRMIMPQFGDFNLSPSTGNDKYLFLNWNALNSDYLLGPHQLSDGSLRFMALAALLLQPPEFLPDAIILDEPELGLHPVAISSLAGIIGIASQHAQVIMATQSPMLVNEFSLDKIVVVSYDRQKMCSSFSRPDENALSEWIQEYSLAELWEKNIFGGRP